MKQAYWFGEKITVLGPDKAPYVRIRRTNGYEQSVHKKSVSYNAKRAAALSKDLTLMVRAFKMVPEGLRSEKTVVPVYKALKRAAHRRAR